MLNLTEGLETRDYCHETIQFFTDKLLTYGNAEVPVKSLFGHRSQAPSEIRHVSGQNDKEFKDFLCAHPDVFVLRDDYVVLRTVLDKFENDTTKTPNSILRRMPEEVNLDPYLMQQLMTELEETLFTLTQQLSHQVSIELLFNTMQSKPDSPCLWSTIVKVPSDLITFLHMNSKIFLVQGHMISLTTEREKMLLEKKKAGSNSAPKKESHNQLSSNSR